MSDNAKMLVFKCTYMSSNGKKYTKKVNQAAFVNWIPEHGFRGDKDLYAIDIPSGIKSIGLNVFLGCSNLKKVTLRDGIKEIHSSAFEGCTNLEEINIPKTVEEIGNDAFRGCSKLKVIKVYSQYIHIHERAFDEGVEIQYM